MRKFVIAHAYVSRARVHVFRSFSRAVFHTAIKKATAIRRAGYPVWIEAVGKPATR